MKPLSLLRKPMVLLVLALALVWVADRVGSVSPDVVADLGADVLAKTSTQRANASSDVTSTSTPNTTLRLERLQGRHKDAGTDPALDLFAGARMALPLQPAASAAPPPPPPKAPPFPHAYVGSMVEDGHRIAFFARGEQVFKLAVGDVVDGQYRVDQLLAQRMSLTFLPLDQALFVALGATR